MNITVKDVNRTLTDILDIYRKSLASGRDSFNGWLSTYDKLSGLSMLFINDSEIYALIQNALNQLDVIKADHENRLKTQEIVAEVDQELTAHAGQGGR